MCAMSMNAQVVKLYKDGQLKYTYSISEVDEVKFEEQQEEPPVDPPADPTQYYKNFSVNGTMGDRDFTGFGSNTLTASNEDVIVMLTLSRGEAWWNDDGLITCDGDITLTVEVIPRVSGVTITSFDLHQDNESIINSGEGPWYFAVNSLGVISGNGMELNRLSHVTVGYTK